MWNEVLEFRDENGQTLRIFTHEGAASCVTRIESVVRGDKNLRAEQVLLVEYHGENTETGGSDFRMYKVQNRIIPASYYIEVVDRSGIRTVVDKREYEKMGFVWCKLFNEETACMMQFVNFEDFTATIRFMRRLGKFQIEVGKEWYDVDLGVTAADFDVQVKTIFG